MEEQILKQRIRMIKALDDFQLALSAADFLQEAQENERYSVIELRRFRCYEHTAIISYARPFSQSKNGLPKLSLKNCSANLDLEEKTLHDKVIALRNKLVAHSDLEMMNFASKAYDLSERVGSPFFALLSEHDEGLQFYRWEDQLKLMDLIRTVFHAVYSKLHDWAQNDPEAFNLTIHYPRE